MSLRFLFHGVLLTILLMAAPGYAQTVDPFDLLFQDELSVVDAGENDQVGDDDLQVLTFKIRELTVDEGFVAFRTSAGLCLPFKETVDIFEFPIEIVNDEHATGWFITPEQKLEVDFERGTAEINGIAAKLETTPFFQTEDGWCATTTAMSEIFPINFEHDQRHLSVVAEPMVFLPIEERLEREAFREKNLRAKSLDDQTYPLLANPYRWVSWPVADAGMDVRMGSVGDLSFNFELEAAADILKTTGRFRTSGQSKDKLLNNLRMTFGRTTLEPSLLGPLKARDYKFGDISTPPVPLVTNSVNGAGFVVTNRSSFNADLFDTTEIRGPLPINWEAELYAGEELITFVINPDSNGDYVFQDVPLRSGFNRFTVKLFGPYGQKEERVVKYFIGSELEPENETIYTFGVVDAKSPVMKSLGFANDFDQIAESEEPENFSAGLTTDISEIFEEVIEEAPETPSSAIPSSNLIATGSLSRGISDRFTARLDGVLGLSESNRNEKAAVATLSSSVLGGYGSIRVASRGQGRPAVEVGFQRRVLSRSSISTQFIDFGGFESDISGYGVSRTRRTARIRGNSFVAIGKKSLPVRGEVRFVETVAGAKQIEALGRTSTDWRHFRVSNTLQFSHISDNGEKNSSLDGSLLFTRKHKGTRWLGGIGYSVIDKPSFKNVGISAQREFLNENIGSLSLVHDFTKKKMALAGSWAKPFKHVTVAATANVDMSGNWAAGLKFGMSLSKKPEKFEAAIISRSGLSRNGGVSPHVFIDTDLDGVYSEGDENLKDVQFAVKKGLRRQQTDSNGITIIDKISTDSIQTIAIDQSSLDDPFLLPVSEGHSFLMRPGQVLAISMPVQATGDAEGHLNVQKGEQTTPIGGTTIQVVDEDGKVVAVSQTDFDGYFYLDKLPLKKLSFRLPAGSLEGTGAVFRGYPFELTLDEPSYFGAELIIYDN